MTLDQLTFPELTSNRGSAGTLTCPYCSGLGTLDATDIFCGAGGSSLGLEFVCCPACGRSLIQVTQALNHWDLAVQAHNANFPYADHDVHDVEVIPATRFRRTDLLWASPECTHHAYCRGPKATTEEAIRSRATFADIIRFTAHHRYDAAIVENVVEARLWWRDLDMRALKVRVTQSYVRGQIGTPKSEGSARAIPLASWLITELEQHHMATVWNQDSDLVLAHPLTGRPLDRVRLGQHFKAALKRADVRPVRIHDLRHTFATTVAASGEVSVRTLQEWMGHEDLRTTQIYAAYMPGERDQELVDGAFGGLGGQLVANPDPAPPPDTPEIPVDTA